MSKEAKDILEGRMSIEEGSTITSIKELEEIKQKIQCLGCGAVLTRSDSMKRHITANCKALKTDD